MKNSLVCLLAAVAASALAGNITPVGPDAYYQNLTAFDNVQVRSSGLRTGGSSQSNACDGAYGFFNVAGFNNNQYLIYSFSGVKKVNAFAITSAGIGHRCPLNTGDLWLFRMAPVAFTLQGSSNSTYNAADSYWTTVGTFTTTPDWKPFEKRTFFLGGDALYKHFRIKFTQPQSGSYDYLSEFEVFDLASIPELRISSNAGAVGTPSPAYGSITALADGVTNAFSASDAAGVTCAGYKLYRRTGAHLESRTLVTNSPAASGSFVADGGIYEVQWQWESTVADATDAAKGSITVTDAPADGYYAIGETFTASAVDSVSGYAFRYWEGVPDDIRCLRTISFPVAKAGTTVKAVFGPIKATVTTTAQLNTALGGAVDGDVILVAPGTYTTSVAAGFTIVRSITIRSTGGPSVTTIDTGLTKAGTMRHFTTTAATATNAVIDGFRCSTARRWPTTRRRWPA